MDKIHCSALQNHLGTPLLIKGFPIPRATVRGVVIWEITTRETKETNDLP
jgi:hypothetical protein